MWTATIPIQSLVKLQPWFLSLEDLPLAELQPRFLRCSEGPALGQLLNLFGDLHGASLNFWHLDDARNSILFTLALGLLMRNMMQFSVDSCFLDM